jgi:hypothetical protein
MTTTTLITLEDAQNAYAWAKKNLSKARRQAFDRQMSKLNIEKCSPEYKNAYRAEQEIVDKHLRANADRIIAIQNEAAKAGAEIDKQIAELWAQKQQIADEMSKRITAIQMEAYNSPEYKEADKITREISQKDLEIYLPKVQSLMQKFLERQLQATTEEEGK